jgi:hypothetical protein
MRSRNGSELRVSRRGQNQATENQEEPGAFFDLFRDLLPARGVDEREEDGERCGVVFDRALGMPLHGEHEMIFGIAFEGFDDEVIGAAGDDAQARSDRVGGLMMGGVNRENEVFFPSG